MLQKPDARGFDTNPRDVMTTASDQFVHEIVEQVATDLGCELNPATIGWISRPDGKENIADSTIAFTVNGRAATDDLVILVSNPRFPSAVQEDAEKARAIAERLTPDIGRHVARPVSRGQHEGQTYSAFSRLIPMSDAPMVRYVQKRFSAPKVTSWAASLALQTQQFQTGKADYERHFLDPLRAICSDPDHAPDFRRFAERCLKQGPQTESKLFTCVEHGDFWYGNVLFERMKIPQFGAISGDFFVIDWRGSSGHGYPCADIIRFCASIFTKGSRPSRTLLDSYRTAIGIDRIEMGLYSALSLARLGANLDKFPRARYYTLCRKTFGYLNYDGSLSA